MKRFALIYLLHFFHVLSTGIEGFLFLAILPSIVCQEIDLAIVLSSFTNTGRDTPSLDSIKNLVQKIYSNFTIGDSATHVALITSGRSSKIVFDFNAYKNIGSLNQVLKSAVFLPNEPSNMGKALDLANYGLFKNTGRPNADKFLLVIAQNKSYDNVERAAQDLKDSGVNVLTVGIGKALYQDDFKDMATPPKQYNTVFGDLNSLDNIATSVVTRIRYIAETGTVSSTPVQGEIQDEPPFCSKKCEKEVNGEKVPINCNNCKLAGCCHLCCDNANHPVYTGPIQLGFLLDESGELTNWNNFETVKGFIRNFSRNFDISDKNSKLGIITFSRDNMQIHDLRSYHERTELDSHIEKLNYEGALSYPGSLNKGLDSSQTSLFSDPRDLSIPRVLLVLDSGSVKNDQTEVKAFKLHSSDIQTFCIGLGLSYNKEQCERMVEQPIEKHSLAAEVNQLGELRDTITLMIANDIAEKYCLLCTQGNTDACKPCKTARHYMGNDKGFQNVKPSHILKIMNTFDKDPNKNTHMKSSSQLLQESDEDDDDDDDDVQPIQATQNINGLQADASQIGTTLPDVDLVKGILNNGIAPDTIQPSQFPLTAGKQLGLPQRNPIFQQPQVPMFDSTLPQLAMSPQTNTQTSQLLSQMLGTQQGTALTGNTNSPTSSQQLPIDQSLLNQAVLGNGKFQRRHKSGTVRKHASPNLDSALPLPYLTPDTDTMNQELTASQAGPLNPGVTSSMPILQPPLREQTVMGDSVPPNAQRPAKAQQQFQAPAKMQQQQQQQQQPQFEDEYKYDKYDQKPPYKMPCKDLSDECESYATEGGCDEFAPLSSFGQVDIMCKKSCGLCNEVVGETKKKSHTKEKARHYKKLIKNK